MQSRVLDLVVSAREAGDVFPQEPRQTRLGFGSDVLPAHSGHGY